MFARRPIVSRSAIARLCRNVDGSIAPIFALMATPMLIAVGASVDYSRANSVKTVLQAVIDSAVLAGAKEDAIVGNPNWSQLAVNMFQSNLSAKTAMAATPAFTLNSDGSYTGSVTGSVPTSLLGIINIRSLTVTAQTKAVASAPDNSCILTLDHGQSKSHVSLNLNGAPIVNLTGCSIRSNTSLDCNGHDGNVTKGIASGTSVDCGQPKSYAPVVPDLYASLANNISTQCGTSTVGVSWTPGSIPTGAGIKTVSNGSYTEYHICGDLNL